MKGWLVIGACILGIVAFIGLLYVLGQWKNRAYTLS